jgi:hypothetical protein
MRSGSRKFGWIFRLLRLLFVSALFIASIPPSWASAQATADPWAVPVNLSHSGVTLNSAIVVDSDAVVHAVWQDDLANFVYTRFDEDQWSAPETTNLDRLFDLPIASESGNRSELAVHTGPNPLFIAGPGEHIFAFWITPKGRLFTSRVKNIGFKHVAAWDSERLITPDVVSFAVAVDELGELHLVFFRTADDPKNPPGIYYTRSKYSGRNWAIPMLLYESPYIRKLGAGEANLSIATTGTGDAPRVYVAWDNRSRKEVLLTQSADGGKSWDQPALVAGPAPDSRSVGPFNIHVGANQNSVVLVWQSGEPGGTCTQIYQSSRDEGATWSDPQPMIEDLLGCAESNEFVTGLPQSPESPLYFLTKTQSQVFLTAWNGLQWSHSQAQPTLSEFEDPEIYTEIVYGCHRTSLSGEQLYVIGCDQGGGGEAWVTSRDLGSTASWFEPPVWSQLSPVTSDNFRLEALELVATEDGLIHTFFSQHQDPAIYYTYWDGALWSRITPVLELPEGEAAWPAIAAGPGNELFLIAKSNRGMLYFSRATSGNAATASSWSTPAPLGIGHDGEVGSVDIAWDAAGTVYVAYALPVNEERGIYLVLSKDQGTTWSEPLKVFDGAAAGFDLIGAPSLLTSSNGFVHVLWKEQSIQGDGVPQPISLYYARSEDGGQTFNDAELVVEEPASWREIMADGQGNLHVLWQPQDTLTTVWDQVSLDGGQTWQFPQGLPDEGRLAAVTGDSAGRLHLVGVGPDALGHWLWDGSRWQSEVPLGLPLSSQQESPIALLAAVVNRQGKMMVVLAEPTVEGNVGERTLLYSFRTLDIPSKETNVQETPTETLSSPTMVPVTPTLEPLSTLTASVDNQSANTGQTEGIETSDSPSPFIMALVPVALLLLVVLGMVVRRASQLKDR